ncbi:MAG: SRPBCC domain-containing protein [Gemmatimonadaceae bacterium]|nr:SRPBCC domain-containing protein [Gemmatimonadaceae bacterium]
MPDILLSFPILRDAPTVFDAMTAPAGLDGWWTLDSEGLPVLGAQYRFGFGPSCQWTGEVTRCEAPRAFEWTMRDADADWTGTRVGFTLKDIRGGTLVEFFHRGWPLENEHFRGSSYCWASYLRILRRHLEHGEHVPYEQRDSV